MGKDNEEDSRRFSLLIPFRGGDGPMWRRISYCFFPQPRPLVIAIVIMEWANDRKNAMKEWTGTNGRIGIKMTKKVKSQAIHSMDSAISVHSPRCTVVFFFIFSFKPFTTPGRKRNVSKRRSRRHFDRFLPRSDSFLLFCCSANHTW